MPTIYPNLATALSLCQVVGNIRFRAHSLPGLALMGVTGGQRSQAERGPWRPPCGQSNVTAS